MRSFLLCASAGLALAVDTLVDVSYTKYKGTALQNGVTQWLGLRYAAPPLGDLRFAPPQDPLANGTIQVADAHGAICLGTGSAPSNKSSEDCLFLDVYAPTGATSASKLPVYFYIQGGGFNTNSNPNYNGSGLINASGGNIVVVNFNYRVGPYGFLAGKEVVANNGLRDQRKALQWFGGNPGHVVLGGDSAGAASINLQLTAYNGRNDGLFHASAAESQSFATIRTVSESQYQYNNLVIRTGCASDNDTLACLRSLNATFLQSQNNNTAYPGAQQAPLYMYNPTLDHDFVTDYTYAAYAKGKFVRLPAIYGDVTNEGTIFAPNSTATIGQSDTFLLDQFPQLSLQQLAMINYMYPVSEHFNGTGAFWRQLANAYGEIRYICPGIFISNVYADLKLASNWNYHWDVLDPTQDTEGFGVPHTVEKNAIWGPAYVSAPAPASYNTTNANIVPVVQAYWTSFIRTFDPNTYRAPGTPVWEAWGKGAAANQRLLFQTNNTRMETVPLDQQERCAYLSSIGPDLRQ
ncbi:hypothetical protein MBLNU459_g7099t1 [Dothideomycetes sp. NU459]